MESNEASPEVTESAKEEAAKMASAYDDRPTAVLPGSHNTVTGTAINDWLDEDGNPKYGKDKAPADGSAADGSADESA
jgi:hypothetical protein